MTGYIRRAFDSAIMIEQLPVTTAERRAEMSAVRDDRTRGLVAAVLRGGPSQRSVPVADHQKPVRTVGSKLIQLVTPSHGLFRRSGTEAYFGVPDSRDWDNTFFRIFPGLNMTLRRAGT